jgi:hypothetical protein
MLMIKTIYKTLFRNYIHEIIHCNMFRPYKVIFCLEVIMCCVFLNRN